MLNDVNPSEETEKDLVEAGLSVVEALSSSITFYAKNTDTGSSEPPARSVERA